jgi:hypothetical protein
MPLLPRWSTTSDDGQDIEAAAAEDGTVRLTIGSTQATLNRCAADAVAHMITEAAKLAAGETGGHRLSEGSAGWRRPDWPPEVEEHIHRVLAALPPLSDAQCEQVARLLAPWSRPDGEG